MDDGSKRQRPRSARRCAAGGLTGVALSERNAAAARDPNGTGAVGLSNYTAPAFDPPAYDPNGGWPAQAPAVTVRVPELASVKSRRFAVHRSGNGVNDVPDGILIMHSGEIVVPRVGPLDLITLHSLPAARK